MKPLQHVWVFGLYLLWLHSFLIGATFPLSHSCFAGSYALVPQQAVLAPFVFRLLTLSLQQSCLVGSNALFPQQTEDFRCPAFANLLTLPSQQILLVKSNTTFPQQHVSPADFFLLIFPLQQWFFLGSNDFSPQHFVSNPLSLGFILSLQQMLFFRSNIFGPQHDTSLFGRSKYFSSQHIPLSTSNCLDPQQHDLLKIEQLFNSLLLTNY